MMEAAVGSPKASHSMLREEIKSSHLSSSDSPCPSASLGDENSPLKKWKGRAVTEAFGERG